MGRTNLDARQREFSQQRARGLGRQQSAVMAGYGDYDKVGEKVEESPVVQQEIARLKAQTAKNCGITKEDVAAGFKDAADMAKTMSDPTGMVAAWRELGKLLGYYAPEVKKLEKGINKRDLLAAMDSMTDEELLQLKGGRVIEGKVESRAIESLPLLPPQPA